MSSRVRLLLLAGPSIALYVVVAAWIGWDRRSQLIDRLVCAVHVARD